MRSKSSLRTLTLIPTLFRIMNKKIEFDLLFSLKKVLFACLVMVYVRVRDLGWYHYYWQLRAQKFKEGQQFEDETCGLGCHGITLVVPRCVMLRLKCWELGPWNQDASFCQLLCCLPICSSNACMTIINRFFEGHSLYLQ